MPQSHYKKLLVIRQELKEAKALKAQGKLSKDEYARILRDLMDEFENLEESAGEMESRMILERVVNC